MKKILSLLFLLITVHAHSQRFDWVSHTPLLSGNGGNGSGGLCITRDNDGFNYTACTFTEPILIGTDTIFPGGNVNSSNMLICKWNDEGEVVLTKQLWSFGSYVSPFDMTYDALNGQVIVSVAMFGGFEVVGDTILNAAPSGFIRFTENLDFISYKPLIDTYNSEILSKDGFLYSANGYTSQIAKYDTSNAVVWSLTPTVGDYNVVAMAMSQQNILYVIGYMMHNLANSPITLGGVTVNAPSTGNYTHTALFRIDSAGNVLSGSYLVESSGSGNLLSMAMDADDNLFVACPYTIGGQFIGVDSLSTPVGANDVFVVKMDSLFQPLWVTEFQHTGGNMESRGVAVGPSGKVLVTGNYGGAGTFGSFQLTVPNPYGTGYLAQLNNADGAVLYATNFGSLQGTGRPHGVYNVGDKYYITGRSYGSGLASFGCYDETFACQYITCFNDTVFQVSSVSLQFTYPNLIATSNVPNAVYTWYENGVEISGVTGNTYTPQNNALYEVKVNEYYGCEASATYQMTNVGLDEHADAGVSLFPNPSSGTVTVLYGDSGNADYKVEVTDVVGNVVYEQSQFMSGMQIDLSSLTQGIYLVHLTGEKRMLPLKLIKTKY